LEGIPPHEREEFLLAHVREQVVNVLGMDPSRPPGLRDGLTDMGMDSLMAVELRNRLEAGAGRSLPATLAFEHPTIEAISTYLGEVLLSGTLSVPSRRESGGRDDRTRNQAELEDLPQDALEATLLAELDEAGY
jgi:acyl carrier protein